MAHFLSKLLAAPSRSAFLPDSLRGAYATLARRGFGLFRQPMATDITGIGQMVLEPWDFVDSRLFFFDVWEPAMSRFMRTTIVPGMVVADIGANIGYYTLLMSRAVGPDGHVFAVEPSPKIRPRLEDALARNGITNVTVIPYGISDRAERRSFTHVQGNSGESYFGEPDDGAEAIELRALADVIPPDMLARLSFIKVDVEGMEAPVMRHIATLLPILPRQLCICAELPLDKELREIARGFVDAGMESFGLPNLYAAKDYPSHPLEAEKIDVTRTHHLDVALVRR